MLNDEKFLDDPRRAVQLGLGFTSPLWPTFFVATSAGVAFWAWSQWLRGKAQSEFSPVLAGAPVAAEPAVPPPVSQPIPEPVATVAHVATEAVEETVATATEAVEEIAAPVTAAVSEAIASGAAILAEPVTIEDSIEDPVELTPEALSAEAGVSESPLAGSAAMEPLAAASAKPARHKRVEAAAPVEAAPEEPSTPPAAPKKPRAQAVAAAPRKVRAAKAAGEPAPTGPKRRNIPRRRS